MKTERQITNLHEACQAYRDGYRWAGSNCGGLTYAHYYKSAENLYSKEDKACENFWQLYRQISFMVVGTEPFDLRSKIDTVPENKFEGLTVLDMITIATCINCTFHEK